MHFGMGPASTPLLSFLTAFVAILAGRVTGSDDTVPSSTVVYTEVGPADTDRLWPIYEDSLVKMWSVNYGTADARSEPGFYVLRREKSDWVRVEKVSTLGAVFGRNPTFDEVRAAGKIPPSIGWDFRPLAQQAYVPFPLQFAGFLFFPDKVERNSEAGEYILHFNSSWEIEGVETVLRFRIDDLLTGGDSKP